MTDDAEPDTTDDAESPDDEAPVERQQTMIVRLPESLHAQFRQACTDEDRSMSAQVRRLIQQFLDER